MQPRFLLIKESLKAELSVTVKELSHRVNLGDGVVVLAPFLTLCYTVKRRCE